MILCAQARPPAKWNEEGGGVAEERVLSLDVERPARESFAALRGILVAHNVPPVCKAEHGALLIRK